MLSIDDAKREAKRLCRSPLAAQHGIQKLSQAQAVVAIAKGFPTWHALQAHLSSTPGAATPALPDTAHTFEGRTLPDRVMGKNAAGVATVLYDKDLDFVSMVGAFVGHCFDPRQTRGHHEAVNLTMYALCAAGWVYPSDDQRAQLLLRFVDLSRSSADLHRFLAAHDTVIPRGEQEILLWGLRNAHDTVPDGDDPLAYHHAAIVAHVRRLFCGAP